MYAFSPMIINSMMSGNPYKAPLIGLIITIACKFVITGLMCPKIYNDDLACETENQAMWFGLYAQMYTRAGPYFMGMIAGYWHLNPDSAPDYRKAYSIFLEYLSFIILIVIGCFMGAQDMETDVTFPS
jgi:hypothetical protein